jgi:hypothetical protein
MSAALVFRDAAGLEKLRVPYSSATTARVAAEVARRDASSGRPWVRILGDAAEGQMPLARIGRESAVRVEVQDQESP